MEHIFAGRKAPIRQCGSDLRIRIAAIIMVAEDGVNRDVQGCKRSQHLQAGIVQRFDAAGVDIVAGADDCVDSRLTMDPRDAFCDFRGARADVANDGDAQRQESGKKHFGDLKVTLECTTL